MDWVRILAFVTGLVDQGLSARIEYLAAENRILKARLKGRLKLSDAERAELGELGHRLVRKLLAVVAVCTGNFIWRRFWISQAEFPVCPPKFPVPPQ